MSSSRNNKFTSGKDKKIGGVSDKDLNLFLQEIPLLTDSQLDKLSMEVFAESMERSDGDEISVDDDFIDGGHPPWEDELGKL